MVSHDETILCKETTDRFKRIKCNFQAKIFRIKTGFAFLRFVTVCFIRTFLNFAGDGTFSGTQVGAVTASLQRPFHMQKNTAP